MKEIVIYGTGGFGREIMDALTFQNQKTKQYEIVGFIDDNDKCIGTQINGYPVLGTGEFLLASRKPISVLVCIGTPTVRKGIIERLCKNPMIEYPNFIANGVQFNLELVQLGKGNIIASRCDLTVNIAISNFNIINLQCTVGHDCIMEDYVTLAPGCRISGNVTIEEGCDIGTGTCIRQGLTIGTQTVVGMGSVVVKDIPSHVMAYGNPCRVQ